MMNPQARLLAQSGVGLLAVSLVNGLIVHLLPLPLLGAHLIGLLGSLFLFAFASLWPHLDYTSLQSKIAAVSILYGFVIGWLVNFVAGFTETFGIFPISVSSSHKESSGDLLISIGLLSVALALFMACVMLFLGLRKRAGAVPPHQA